MISRRVLRRPLASIPQRNETGDQQGQDRQHQQPTGEPGRSARIVQELLSEQASCHVRDNRGENEERQPTVAVPDPGADGKVLIEASIGNKKWTILQCNFNLSRQRAVRQYLLDLPCQNRL